MRHQRWWTGMILVLLLLAACVDAPTAPTAASRGGPNHDVLLDPIIVIGEPKPKECDPWLDLNWCEDGGSRECMESGPSIDDPENVGMTGCNDGGGDGDGSPPPSPTNPPGTEQPDTCKTGEKVLDALDVWTGFQALWLKSKLEGVERGGWIVADGSTFQLVPFRNAVFTACGIDLYESPPAGAVSLVHTHPWALFAVNPCGYINIGTPSQEDIRALQQAGLSTGYFLDEGGIGKFTATGGERAQRITRCGY